MKPIHVNYTKDVSILPIADIHFGSRQFNTDKWEETKKLLNNNPDMKIMMLGDECDMILRNSVGSPWENTMSPQEQLDFARDELRPYADRILSAVGSNHMNRVGRDTSIDITKELYSSIGLKNVYHYDFASVKFHHNGNVVTVFTHHGAGAGKRVGGTINKIEDFALTCDADLIIVGHCHHGASSVTGRLVYDEIKDEYIVKPVKTLICSAYLGYGGYGSAAMLSPQAFQFQGFTITTDGKIKTWTE